MDHLTALREQITLVERAIGPLDMPVPACPGWSAGDLIGHLGSVYRMFRRVADDGLMARPPRGPDPGKPATDDPAMVAWFGDQAARLLAALEVLDPVAPRWNFGPGAQVGAFIPRRMHHETLVHRWDLEAAHGEPGPIRLPAAADGVREYLEVTLPRFGVWPHPPERIRFIARPADPVDLALEEGRIPRVAPATGPATASITANADKLLLAVWGRRPLTELAAERDRLVVERLRAFTAR